MSGSGVAKTDERQSAAGSASLSSSRPLRQCVGFSLIAYTEVSDAFATVSERPLGR